MVQPIAEFERQVTHETGSKIWTAKCAVCGKEFSAKKRFFNSLDGVLMKLRFNFNFCRHCGCFVCNGCYLVYDRDGRELSRCRNCAEKQGITNGLTNAEFDEVFPEMERKRKKNNEQGTVKR
jgi:hypothetical protein